MPIEVSFLIIDLAEEKATGMKFKISPMPIIARMIFPLNMQ